MKPTAARRQRAPPIGGDPAEVREWLIESQRVDSPAAEPQVQEAAAPLFAAAPAMPFGLGATPPTAASVLALQRRAGNRAVAGLLLRQGHDHDPLDAGTKPPPPGASTLKIGEYEVPVGKDAQQHAMEELIKARGRDGPRKFHHDARMALDRATPSAGVAADQENLDKVKKALDELEPVITKLEQDYDALLLDFEAAAREALITIADDSQKRTEAEAFRYGLTSKDIEVTQEDSSGSHTSKKTDYDMTEGSQAKAGIAEAAKQLLKRKAEMKPLEEKVAQLKMSYNLSGEASGGLAEKPEGYDEAIKELDGENLRYEALITQLAGEYPAIDAIARNNPGGLEAIANGTAKDAAMVIGPQIKDRLAKVERVRKGKDAIDVFKVPKVVAMTKARQRIAPDSWQDDLVDKKAHPEHDPDELLDAALAVVNLALIMLAPLTGGASLIVAAGVSTGVAAQHMQQYMLEDAMAGSDLDKAKALSQTEPSLLWLAVDVVMAIFDVGTAAKTASRLLAAYRPVEEAVKAARLAKATEEVAAARTRVEKACEEAGGEKLAKKVLAGLERDGEIASGVSKEMRAVEGAAAAAAEKELKGAVTAATERGHVHVSERGVVFSCESPCLEVRNKYATELSDPAFKDRLSELETIESDWNKLGKEATDAQKKAIAKRAATLDDKLAGQVLKARAAKLADALPSMHPVFQEYKLDAAAVERIISRKEVSHIKGQLMEELLATDITKQLKDTNSEVFKLVGPLAEGEVPEFIPGHLIRDSEGWLTDGMIVVRRGGGYDVRVIIEAKAGAASAVELKGVRDSLDELSNLPLDQINPAGLRKAAAGRIDNLNEKELASLVEGLQELRMEGIERLRASNPKKYGEMVSSEIDQKFRAQVTRKVRDLPKTREGQLLHDTERLAEAERLTRGVPTEGADWKGLTINNEPAKLVNRGRPKVIAGLPAEMDEKSFLKRLGTTPDPKDPKTLKGDRLDVSVVHGPLTPEELNQVSADIARRAAAPAP
jgi:hypothetical protein